MQGYRSYIIAILIASAGIAHQAGYINDSIFNLITTLLGSGAIMTIRSAIATSEKK